MKRQFNFRIEENVYEMLSEMSEKAGVGNAVFLNILIRKTYYSSKDNADENKSACINN